MQKRIILITVLIAVLLTSSFILVQPVKASPGVMVDLPWGRVTGVNQPVTFTATGSGGSPPYVYQWYTTFLDPTVSGDQWITVPVPGATSSNFTFTKSTPGRYGISIRITDSEGEGEYQSFQPIGIVVTVQPTTLPQPTPSIHPTPTPSPPNINFNSPQNATYKENNVPLTFSLSQPTQWIAYSLDKQANITITGNTTLTGLGNGQHTIIIYTNDTYGNSAEPKTIGFTVKVPAAFSTFALALLIPIVVLGLGLAFGLVIKHKQKQT